MELLMGRLMKHPRTIGRSRVERTSSIQASVYIHVPLLLQSSHLDSPRSSNLQKTYEDPHCCWERPLVEPPTATGYTRPRLHKDARFQKDG
jgi:hypothetical protein